MNYHLIQFVNNRWAKPTYSYKKINCPKEELDRQIKNREIVSALGTVGIVFSSHESEEERDLFYKRMTGTA